MLDVDELVYILGIVLALKGIDIVQAFIDTSQFCRIVVQCVNYRADTHCNIFEVDKGASHSFGHAFNLIEVLFGVFQPLGN